MQSAKLVLAYNKELWNIYIDKQIIMESLPLPSAVAVQLCLHFIMGVEYAAPKTFSIFEYLLGMRSKSTLTKPAKSFLFRYKL